MAKIDVHHTWSCTEITEVEVPDNYKSITEIEFKHGKMTVRGLGPNSEEFEVSEYFVPDNDPDYSGSPDIVEAWTNFDEGELVYKEDLRC